MYDLFFNWYLHAILKKDFSRIDIVGEWLVDKDSCLLIGNHVSWWDGFWVYYLNKRFLHKKLYVMMLESQLKKNSFLSRIGAFSIKPGSRAMVFSLDYASSLLKENGNLVVMYPQGEIASFSAGVLPFKSGLSKIINNSGLKKVMFYVALVDYFSERKPVLTLYLGSSNVERLSTGDVQRLFDDFYKQALELQSHKKK